MTARLPSSTSLSEHFRPGHRVFAAGLSGESALLRDELRKTPDRAAGVEFTSIQLPGVDQTDYAGLHAEAKTVAYFMTPATRTGMAAGKSQLYPLDYSGIARHLLEAAPFDCAIGQFTTPDDRGWCSPGLSSDFLPLVWTRAQRRLGHLNPRLPRIESSFKVHVSEFDAIVEADGPPLCIADAAPSLVNQAIGRHAAQLIRDGDTLQFGIGSVMGAVGQALLSHRRLRIHSGMAPVLVKALWDSGALDRDARVITGVLFGDTAFHDWAGEVGCVYLDDVRNTHAVDVVCTIPRFVAVNGAVEVDLFGQVNSERSDGTLQAGAGGLPAFAQGAQLSADGRLLVCLPSTARRGQVSRIVPSLSSKGICTVPRYLSDAIITEFGVAELRGRSMADRAQALISVAHPQHRETLSVQWEALARSL